jgi:hypothetical protein
MTTSVYVLANLRYAEADNHVDTEVNVIGVFSTREAAQAWASRAEQWSECDLPFIDSMQMFGACQVWWGEDGNGTAHMIGRFVMHEQVAQLATDLQQEP